MAAGAHEDCQCLTALLTSDSLEAAASTCRCMACIKHPDAQQALKLCEYSQSKSAALAVLLAAAAAHSHNHLQTLLLACGDVHWLLPRRRLTT